MNWNKYKVIIILVFSILTQNINAEFNETDFSIRRNALLEEEKLLAFGGKKSFNSVNETLANNLLMKYKTLEFNNAISNASEFYPSFNFLDVKKGIEQSKVFKIIKKMPKGAVLNIHASALVSAKWIYENVTFRDNVYICIRSEKLYLRVFNKPTEDCDWQLLSELRNNETLRDQTNFRIQKDLTLETKNIVEDKDYLNNLFARLRKIFDIRVPLLRYKPIFEDYLYQGLKELYEDNVMFLEVRTPLLEMYDLEGMTYDEEKSLKIYADVTQRFIKDHPDFMGVKIIYSLYRKMNPSDMKKHIDKAIKLKEKYSDLLVGFDLIGLEDSGEPLSYWIPIIKPLINHIDFYFHAGETKWYGLHSDENLFDAVLLNTKRIGQGYALTKHPKVLELMREKNIPVEVCPITNQVLGLVKDLRNHPANILFAQDFPIVISSNDPGAWEADALSHDFYEAFMGLMSSYADIRALRKLAIDSIEYSSMNDQEKNLAYKIWQRKWNEFIDTLVAEYTEKNIW